MSRSIDPSDEAEEAIKEKQDLLKRIADSDLAISDDIDRILELVRGDIDDD